MIYAESALRALAPFIALFLMDCIRAAELPAEASQSTCHEKRCPIEVADLMRLEDDIIFETAVSKDGKWLAYTTWRDHNASPGASDRPIFLKKLSDSCDPVRIGSGYFPQWNRDGSRLAYYSSLNGQRQLWVFERQTGQSREITRVIGGILVSPTTRYNGYLTDPETYSWSPDGTRIAYTTLIQRQSPAHAARPDEPIVLDAASPPGLVTAGLFKAEDQRSDIERGFEAGSTGTNEIFVVDVDTGVDRQLTKGTAGCFNPAWSPGGKSIACVSTHGAPIGADGAPSSTNIDLLDPQSGLQRPLTNENHGIRHLPKWSPDGKQLVYLGGPTALGFQHPFILNADGSEGPKVAYPTTSSIYRILWMPDSRRLLVSNGGGLAMTRVGGPTDKYSDIVNPRSAVISGISISVSDDGAVFFAEHSTGIGDKIVRIVTRDRPPRPVLQLDADIMTRALGQHVLVHWKNSRGESLAGLLILPVHHNTGDRFPVIVDVYPGYAKSVEFLASDPMMGDEALASEGFGVFFPAWRGPHVWMNVDKGKDFADAAKGVAGWEVTRDDIMSGIDEIVRAYDADENRLCLTGFSNGGLIVDYLVTVSHRFKCAVSASAVQPDWVSAYLLYAGFDVPRILGLPGSPLTDTSTYINLSPVFHLEQVSTPILLAAGDLENTMLFGSIEFYNGLRWLGKDVVLLRYPGQRHGFVGSALQDFWNRRLAFFREHLAVER